MPGNRFFIHGQRFYKSMTVIPHVSDISIISIDLIIRREHSHLCCSRNNRDNFPWQMTCVHVCTACASWAGVHIPDWETSNTTFTGSSSSPGGARTDQGLVAMARDPRNSKVWGEDPGPGEREETDKVCLAPCQWGDDIIPWAEVGAARVWV